MGRPEDGPAGRAPGVAVLGKVVGLYGVRGWVKVFSYCRCPADILSYPHWGLRQGGVVREMRWVEGRGHGPGIVARLEGVDDRDAAAGLLGAEIAVPAGELPPLPPGEYYWAELQGLRVVNTEGVVLGKVSHLFETGANDVMAVRNGRERLIPYTPDAIRRVDLEDGLIEVEWDAEF